MRHAAATYFIALLFAFLLACQSNAPTPPNGWQQRVNNGVIGKITFAGDQVRNCATTSGRHVICPQSNDTLDYLCTAVITFTDGTPTQRWELPCELVQETDTLLFDDGQQTYFYGTKK